MKPSIYAKLGQNEIRGISLGSPKFRPNGTAQFFSGRALTKISGCKNWIIMAKISKIEKIGNDNSNLESFVHVYHPKTLD